MGVAIKLKKLVTLKEILASETIVCKMAANIKVTITRALTEPSQRQPSSSRAHDKGG